MKNWFSKSTLVLLFGAALGYAGASSGIATPSICRNPRLRPSKRHLIPRALLQQPTAVPMACHVLLSWRWPLTI